MELFISLLPAIIALAFGVAAVVTFRNVSRKFKSTLTSLFGSSDLSKVANLREIEMQETPKSISGIESLVRGKIEEDFPSLSIAELKSRNEDEVYEYFSAIQTGDLSRFEENEAINAQLKNISAECTKAQIKFNKIKIHKHAISEYRYKEKLASIKFQLSLEYIKSSADDLSGTKTQSRVQTEWVFMLDSENFGAEIAATINCPNCGATISDLSHRVCEYCMSNIEVDHSRTWQLNSINEF